MERIARFHRGILASRRKDDAGKVRLPSQMQTQTTMPLTSIAQGLNTGTRGTSTWPALPLAQRPARLCVTLLIDRVETCMEAGNSPDIIFQHYRARLAETHR